MLPNALGHQLGGIFGPSWPSRLPVDIFASDIHQYVLRSDYFASSSVLTVLCTAAVPARYQYLLASSGFPVFHSLVQTVQHSVSLVGSIHQILRQAVQRFSVLQHPHPPSGRVQSLFAGCSDGRRKVGAEKQRYITTQYQHVVTSRASWPCLRTPPSQDIFAPSRAQNSRKTSPCSLVVVAANFSDQPLPLTGAFPGPVGLLSLSSSLAELFRPIAEVQGTTEL
jgi:hypothetical protein